MLLFSRKEMLLLPSLETMEAPENGHVGIKVLPPKIVAGAIPLLKYQSTQQTEGNGSHCAAGKL